MKPPKTAAPFIPKTKSLAVLKKKVRDCRGCELYKNATQAVFGEGPARARIVLVGEAPGDSEDVAGHPFVGPSGRLLDGALREAGIDRDDIYVTNAVKHFKWIRQGKRRLHQKPNSQEIGACHPWLQAELEKIKPLIVVAMGATAARSIFGKAVTIISLRGKFHATDACELTAVTVHPSAILRSRSEDREKELAAFVSDLKMVARESKKQNPES